MNKHQTILITGAGGMLGLKFAEDLSRKRFRVIAAYHNVPDLLRKIKGIERIGMDITVPRSFAGIYERFQHIDVVIHCAAMTEVNACELDQRSCRRINVGGTRNIAALARRYGAKLVYISTPMVFSGRTGGYKETDIPHPMNSYARAKLAGEKIVLRYPGGLVVRANPIGVRPPRSHPSFIQWFVLRARRNSGFHLFSDVTINPVSTVTLVRIVERLIRDSRCGIVHIGSTDVVNKADIWKFILTYFTGFSSRVDLLPVNMTKDGKIARRPHQMWLNTAKARTEFRIAMPSWKREVAAVLKELGIRSS